MENVVEFKLGDLKSRKRAYLELKELILRDLASGRIPTYHFVHYEDNIDMKIISNHYMTPVSLEPVDKKGRKMLWTQDFLFFLELFLRIKGVREVLYDPKRPAIVFRYYSKWW